MPYAFTYQSDDTRVINITNTTQYIPSESKYYDTTKMLYKEAKGDIKIFQTNEFAIMISKMLSKVYEDRSSFELSVKNMSYYPYMNGIGITKMLHVIFFIRIYNIGKYYSQARLNIRLSINRE